MKTVTYEQIKKQAAYLADRPPNQLPDDERVMLRAFAQSELADLWTLEAWPELSDNLESATLDANRCVTGMDEVGDVLAVLVGGDPRLTANGVTVLPRENYSLLNDRLNVLTTESTVWVDFMNVLPDLLDSDYDDEADLNAVTLPARFYLPLAARMAALLVAEEDPAKAGVLRGLAAADLTRQMARLTRPWWRR